MVSRNSMIERKCLFLQNHLLTTTSRELLKVIMKSKRKKNKVNLKRNNQLLWLHKIKKNILLKSQLKRRKKLNSQKQAIRPSKPTRQRSLSNAKKSQTRIMMKSLTLSSCRSHHINPIRIRAIRPQLFISIQ